MEKNQTIADKIVEIFWESINANRGNSAPYLRESFDVCLYLLYCLHKGYSLDIKDTKDFLVIDVDDEIIRSFARTLNKGLTMRHIKIASSFLNRLNAFPPFDIEEAYAETIAKLLTFNLGTKDMSEFFTPVVFVHVFSRIMRKYGVRNVYNPFAGTAAFCSELDNSVSYLGEEISPNICTYAMVRLESLQHTNASILCRDSVVELQRRSLYEESFDAIIANMPWGNSFMGRGGNYEKLFLEEASEQTKGISIGLYPYNILVGPYAKSIRRHLLNEDLIQTVIKMPVNVSSPQRRLQSCIIITNKHKQDIKHVQFIDASQCVDAEGQFSIDSLMQVLDNPVETNYAKRIPCKDLITDECYLALEPLMRSTIEEPDGFELKRLGDLIHPLGRRGSLPQQYLPFIKVSDLSSKPFEDKLGKLEKVGPEAATSESIFLDRDALLISKVNKLKATYYTHSGEGALTYANIAAYILTEEKLSPKYLVRELWQPYVQEQLVYMGTALGRLSQPLFEEVKILVPKEFDSKVQESLIEQTYQDQLSDSERKLQEAYEEFKGEIGTRKHAIGNTFGAARSLYNVLAGFINEQEHVSCDDVFGEPYPLTVRTALNTLFNYFMVIDSQIKHFTNIDSDYGDCESLSLDEYIKQYIQMYPSVFFKYNYKPSPKKHSSINIARRALDIVFDNIVSNAVDHGFNDSIRKDYEIDFSIDENEDSVILDIANNGNPLAPDFTEEMVFEYGESSKIGEDGHSGMGGSDIKRILKKYNADVELKSTPDSAYTIKYVITFNKQN